MSQSNIRSISPCFGLTLAALLMIAVAPAAAASKAKNRHTVYVVDQAAATSEAVASASPAPAKPAPEPTREDRVAEADPKEKERMKVYVGDSEPASLQEFYPFPEPQAAAQPEAGADRKTLYWAGAAGAALVAGVAAWFIFSGEPERQSPEYAVQ
jgi:hypothetical protein